MDKRTSLRKAFTKTIFITLMICCGFGATTLATTLSPKLSSNLNHLSDNASVGIVIVAFQTSNGLNESHLNLLRGIGVTKRRSLRQLGQVTFLANAGHDSPHAVH